METCVYTKEWRVPGIENMSNIKDIFYHLNLFKR